MTQQLSTEWEAKRTPETRMVEDFLRPSFPTVDAYRYNSASIRVRVIDDRFKGKSVEKRDAMVEPLLDQLPRETQADIMNLLTLYPGETNDFLRALVNNIEFEHPIASEL